MDLRIPNQIVLSFIKQEAGRLCFNQLIAALGNRHPTGELVSSRILPKDQLVELQAAASPQISQVYLRVVLLSQFFPQKKLPAGSTERCGTYRSFAALLPVLEGGMK